MVFEVKERARLEKAKELVIEANVAYEECQGITDLDPESGDLARAIHAAQAARSELTTFLKPYVKVTR